MPFRDLQQIHPLNLNILLFGSSKHNHEVNTHIFVCTKGILRTRRDSIEHPRQNFSANTFPYGKQPFVIFSDFCILYFDQTIFHLF